MADLPSIQTVKKLLKHVLAPLDDLVRLQLVAQVDAISSVSGNTSFLYLFFNSSIPVSYIEDNPLPVSGYATDHTGQPVGEFIIWMEEGRLEMIEWATYLHLGEPWPEIKYIAAKFSPYDLP